MLGSHHAETLGISSAEARKLDRAVWQRPRQNLRHCRDAETRLDRVTMVVEPNRSKEIDRDKIESPGLRRHVSTCWRPDDVARTRSRQRRQTL